MTEEAESFVAEADYVAGCRSEVRFDFSKRVKDVRGRREVQEGKLDGAPWSYACRQSCRRPS